MTIRSVTIDTTGLPTEDQFAAWAGHSDKTALAPRQPGPFLAQGTIWDLGTASIAQCRLDPFVSDRTLAHVNADGAEFVQLVMLVEGSVLLATPAGDHRCSAPDVFIRDYRQVSCATSSAICAIVLYLPSTFLDDAVGAIPYQGILPPCPETALLGNMLPQIVAALPTTAATSAGLLVRALRSLIAAVLIRIQQDRAGQTVGQLARRDRFATQRTAAKDYIAAQPPGQLSLERMIDTLGLSRSVLFSLFKMHGGVLAYDRQIRLRALYRSLRDESDSRPLAELGEAHGFFDRPALANAFRRTFGRSQSEVRSGAAPTFAGTTPAQRIHQLIDQFR